MTPFEIDGVDLAVAFEGRVDEAAAHCLAACEVVAGAYSDVFNCCTFNSVTLQCAVNVGPLYQASSLRPRNWARIVAPVQLCPATPKPTPAPTAPTPAPTAPTPSPTEPRSVDKKHWRVSTTLGQLVDLRGLGG